MFFRIYSDFFGGSAEPPAAPCEHTLLLPALQQSQGTLPDLSNAKLAKCTDCDLCQNLWLCLTCGNLGCSRYVFSILTTKIAYDVFKSAP